MSKQSRKERERQIREEAILDAAESIIQEHGFDGATMDAIAERAEVGKGTLYLHFKSKNSIYLGICIRGSNMLNDSMKHVLLKEQKGIDMVEELGQTYLGFIKSHPIYYSAFNFYENVSGKGTAKPGSLLKKCEECAKEAMTYITRALQIGMQDGSIKSDIEPKELGIIMWGASKGIVHLAMLKEQRKHMEILDEVNFSLESLVKNFMHILNTGIKND